MTRKQYFDIKYPFTNDGTEKYEFDLNSSVKDRVTSDILHVMFTPKRQRLRKPEFGTDLIRYIFEPNDSISWDGVRKEIIDSVSRWVRGVTINNVEVLSTEDGNEIYVRVDYSVRQGNSSYSNSVVVKL